MEKRFIVPALSFIVALLVWATFFILYLKGHWVRQLTPLPEVVLCLFVGGLIIFSAMSCHKAGGPRAGSIVRSAMLLVMAMLTFWKVGIIAASVLLLAAIQVGVKACKESNES